MNYIGVDPAADSFTCSIFKDGKRIGKPKKITSTDELGGKDELGAKDELLHWITGAGCVRQNTLICIENTGVYSEVLLYQLNRAAWPVVLIEPMKVHRAFEKDRPKTDEIDSAMIAEYAWRYRDKLTLWTPHEAVVEQIKVLLTTREQIVKQQTALSNTRKALTRKYIQTPTANSSVDALLEQIRLQIKELEAEIKRLIKAHPTLASTVAMLITAPGVGMLLAAHLLVITGGFTKELSYTQLARHLGIAPLPYESGTSVKRKPKSRGKGPKTMRKLLHLAARSMVTHKAKFKHYYARKLAEGKPAKLVLNNVSNQLLRIVCSMLKHNKPYIDGYVSVNPRLLLT